MLLASAMIPAFAQNASLEVTGVDAALLAKANAGDGASQVLVGDSYAAGKGVPRNSAQAVAWYAKAAAQGNVAAELRLAALYRDGSKGFQRDMAQAAAWYRKAADAGDSGAQATLGVLYSMGQGVPHNDVEAYYWLDLAAQAPGPDQGKYLANRQLVGTRITTDELEAVEERVANWKIAKPRADGGQ
jgi:TPR repeat protein